MIRPADFNPHHPRGWRPFLHRPDASMSLFQSTPPSRVATSASVSPLIPHIHFNPHHPRGWRLRLSIYRIQNNRYFNPHHPRGWRHAPLAHCSALYRFQSTPPSRVATRTISVVSPAATISIHTTLAGGDLCCPSLWLEKPIFQSTPPSRVATFAQCAN